VPTGVDTIVFSPMDPTADQVELLPGEVLPHFRRAG
jgi:hypothetical protein